MARDNWLAPIEMYLKHKWNCFVRIALNGFVDIHTSFVLPKNEKSNTEYMGNGMGVIESHSRYKTKLEANSI